MLYTVNDGLPVTAALRAGDPLTVDGLPVDAEVSIAEGALPVVEGVRWLSPVITVDGAGSSSTATFRVVGGQVQTVALTNYAIAQPVITPPIDPPIDPPVDPPIDPPVDPGTPVVPPVVKTPTPSPAPTNGLAVTGSSAPWITVSAAVVFVIFGAVLVGIRRRRA